MDREMWSAIVVVVALIAYCIVSKIIVRRNPPPVHEHTNYERCIDHGCYRAGDPIPADIDDDPRLLPRPLSLKIAA